MSCSARWMRRLVEHLEDPASPRLRRRVEGHLRNCRACASELSVLRQVRDEATRELAEGSPLRISDEAFLQQVTSRAVIDPHRAPRAAWAAWGWTGVGAAAALSVALLWVALPREPAATPTVEQVAAVLASHPDGLDWLDPDDALWWEDEALETSDIPETELLDWLESEPASSYLYPDVSALLADLQTEERVAFLDMLASEGDRT